MSAQASNAYRQKLKEGIFELSQPAEGVFRLRFSGHQEFQKQFSAPQEAGFKGKGRLRLTHGKGQLEAQTTGLRLQLGKAKGELRLFDSQGTPLLHSGPSAGLKALRQTLKDHGIVAAGGVAGSAAGAVKKLHVDGVRWNFNVPSGRLFYGLGEKVGPLERSGRRWTFWNTDAYQHGPATDPLYKSIPFVLASCPKADGTRVYWGLFLDNASRVYLDLGRLNQRQVVYEAEWGDLDAYLLAGPEPAQVLERLTRLIGRPYLPPLWALGFHQSRYSYMSGKEVRQIADKFKKLGLPLDCIHLDIDYMDGYRVFTWDPKRFAQPEKLVKDLNKQGVHVTAIVDPGVKVDPQYKVYRDGLKQDLFCKTKENKIFEAKVWPGDAVFPDFFNPKAAQWWGQQHADFVNKVGLEGIWNDMNEPALFGNASMEGQVLHRTPWGTKPHAALHNLFGHMMTLATAKGLKKLKPKQRFYLLTRSAYAGIQQASSVWLGDNTSAWEFLSMGLAMMQGIGLSGVAFCGVDVGGFDRDTWGELYARWMQAGALSPFFRNHTANGTRPQEPWAFGPEVLAISRKYLQLRYRLLPYLYTLFEEAHRQGSPILRPLLYEFPQDHKAFNLGDQFMLGPWLMAAPVCKPGAQTRDVYLPQGTWSEYWSGQRYQGGRNILVQAPLDTLPLFVRESALLPGWEPCLNTDQRTRQTLLLDLYPNLGNQSRLDYYEDDGRSRDYQKGLFSRKLFELEYSLIKRQITLKLHPARGRAKLPYQQVHLRFHNLAGRPHRVLVDGKEWPYSKEPAEQVVHGLMPGHVQARLSVPLSAKEVVLEEVPGLTPIKANAEC